MHTRNVHMIHSLKMGQALMHDNERLNEALRYLTKAYNLSVTQKAKFTEEINQSYRTCKRKKWEIDEGNTFDSMILSFNLCTTSHSTCDYSFIQLVINLFINLFINLSFNV